MSLVLLDQLVLAKRILFGYYQMHHPWDGIEVLVNSDLEGTSFQEELRVVAYSHIDLVDNIQVDLTFC